MNIEIHQSRLESLIQQRMASGRFKTVEDALVQALETAPFPGGTPSQERDRTGLDLLEAMQSMPYYDTDIEPLRPHMPVRDVAL